MLDDGLKDGSVGKVGVDALYGSVEDQFLLLLARREETSDADDPGEGIAFTDKVAG